MKKMIFKKYFLYSLVGYLVFLALVFIFSNLVTTQNETAIVDKFLRNPIITLSIFLAVIIFTFIFIFKKRLKVIYPIFFLVCISIIFSPIISAIPRAKKMQETNKRINLPINFITHKIAYPYGMHGSASLCVEKNGEIERLPDLGSFGKKIEKDTTVIGKPNLTTVLPTAPIIYSCSIKENLTTHPKENWRALGLHTLYYFGFIITYLLGLYLLRYPIYLIRKKCKKKNT